MDDSTFNIYAMAWVTTTFDWLSGKKKKKSHGLTAFLPLPICNRSNNWVLTCDHVDNDQEES